MHISAMIVMTSLPTDSAIVAAAQWLTGLVTGTVATGIAVIAIASVGYAMLGGRIDWRRGAAAILGCFLLFGAPTIAQGLRDLARSDSAARPDAFPPQPAGPAPTTPPQQDPYAGAALVE